MLTFFLIVLILVFIGIGLWGISKLPGMVLEIITKVWKDGMPPERVRDDQIPDLLHSEQGYLNHSYMGVYIDHALPDILSSDESPVAAFLGTVVSPEGLFVFRDSEHRHKMDFLLITNKRLIFGAPYKLKIEKLLSVGYEANPRVRMHIKSGRLSGTDLSVATGEKRIRFVDIQERFKGSVGQVIRFQISVYQQSRIAIRSTDGASSLQ